MMDCGQVCKELDHFCLNRGKYHSSVSDIDKGDVITEISQNANGFLIVQYVLVRLVG